MATVVPTLFVLPPSHYCERARWALDRAGITFVEKPWAVGLHLPLAKRIASKTTLPILKIGTRIIQGSGAVLDWTGLSGADPDIEDRFENKIGVLLRKYAYIRALPDAHSGIQQLLFDGVPRWQGIVGRAIWPLTRRAMMRTMDIRQELKPEIEDAIGRELDWFEARLADRTYLVGDRFGRADLTAASLLTPINRLRRSSDEASAVSGWWKRSALAWGRRMYATHRTEIVGVSRN